MVPSLLLLAIPSSAIHEIKASDDVWVYHFAQDQASDEALRVWGAHEGSVAAADGGDLAFSWSMLSFDVSKVEGEVKSAKLVLFHFAEAGFTASESKEMPVEVRSAASSFEEETWDYSMHPKFVPEAGASAVFGTGWGTPSKDDNPFQFTVDLLAGPGDFRTALETAREGGKKMLGLSLTSKMRTPEGGESRVYKFYSRTNDTEFQPKLVIETD
ncbi:MAG: DNRLRE domain-containing protein [Fimbriimonadaceae bacterium]